MALVANRTSVESIPDKESGKELPVTPSVVSGRITDIVGLENEMVERDKVAVLSSPDKLGLVRSVS